MVKRIAKNHFQTSMMAQQVKALGTKPNDLSSVPIAAKINKYNGFKYYRVLEILPSMTIKI